MSRAAALVVLALAGCASAPERVPREHVVLLPGSDGTASGALAVRRGDREAVLDTPYASATPAAGGTIELGHADAASVAAEFGETLKALPPEPAHYLVYFVFGQDELTEESRKAIGPVLEELAKRPAPEITVVGHADQSGPERVNDALSQKRAERVKEMLVARGVPAERIIAAGRGSREPFVRGPEGTAEPRNRRVEITVR